MRRMRLEGKEGGMKKYLSVPKKGNRSKSERGRLSDLVPAGMERAIMVLPGFHFHGTSPPLPCIPCIL